MAIRLLADWLAERRESLAEAHTTRRDLELFGVEQVRCLANTIAAWQGSPADLPGM